MSGEPNIRYFNMGQWPYYVGFTTKRSAFNKECKRLGVSAEFFARSGADATTHFLTKEGRECTAIITIGKPKGRSVSQYAALVAHEALHVVQDMQRSLNCGKPFGDEADAYLLQHIVQSCLQEAYDTNLTRSIEP